MSDANGDGGTDWKPLMDDTAIEGDNLTDRINNNYTIGDNVDAKELSNSLQRVMKSLPLEHLSGAMTSYIGFMNMFIKKNLNKIGISAGVSDEQFETDLKESVVTSKQLARLLHESLMDDETQIFVRELMIKSIDMMRDFTALLLTAFIEQGAAMVVDNGDKISGIVAKGIESAGSAVVDGTLNAFSAVPILGNFFSIIRTIHSLVMPVFTIGGGTLQMVMTGVSIMYEVALKLNVPGMSALNSTYATFNSAKTLGDHVLADIRDGMDNKEGEKPKEEEKPKGEEKPKEGEKPKEEKPKEEEPKPKEEEVKPKEEEPKPKEEEPKEEEPKEEEPKPKEEEPKPKEEEPKEEEAKPKEEEVKPTQKGGKKNLKKNSKKNLKKGTKKNLKKGTKKKAPCSKCKSNRTSKNKKKHKKKTENIRKILRELYG